jgi:hypothetical protein
MQELTADPRYVIGRLSQALTTLVKQMDGAPPLNPVEQLLAQAIEDAAKFRRGAAGACCDEGCEKCLPDERQADLYKGLWAQLGLIGEGLPTPPDLTVVPDGGIEAE